MVICLEWGADLHMAQLMPLPLTVSCFSKIKIGFTFLIPAHPGSPGKRAVKPMCVIVASVFLLDITWGCTVMLKALWLWMSTFTCALLIECHYICSPAIAFVWLLWNIGSWMCLVWRTCLCYHFVYCSCCHHFSMCIYCINCYAIIWQRWSAGLSCLIQYNLIYMFNGPFSGTTQVSRYQKKIWILLKQETVSGSGISWAICKSAPRSRQITMPAPHDSVSYRPDALLAAQPTASKHWWQYSLNMKCYDAIQYKICKAPCCRGFRGAGEQDS